MATQPVSSERGEFVPPQMPEKDDSYQKGRIILMKDGSTRIVTTDKEERDAREDENANLN